MSIFAERIDASRNDALQVVELAEVGLDCVDARAGFSTRAYPLRRERDGFVERFLSARTDHH